ncbi:hypothetical protein BC835DRAFT_1526487 [Cytidiella melzeri]|nr:hypothetical protein BC835DRAFT_1526487 [Cytidiella melzeri]
MRLSTTLVLFAAIVTGAYHTVTVSGVPYPPSSHNLEGPASTGEHTVLSSTPTATLKHDYARSHLYDKSIAAPEEVEAMIAEKRAPPPGYFAPGQRFYTMAVKKRVSPFAIGNLASFATDGKTPLNTGRRDNKKPTNPNKRPNPTAVQPVNVQVPPGHLNPYRQPAPSNPTPPAQPPAQPAKIRPNSPPRKGQP